MKANWWLLSLIVLFASCEVKPQEISYGSDACHFCKMTIVDTKHAAQLVTEKGKAFKYDAIECMLNHLNEWDQAPVRFHLVVDFSNPKVLVDATTAYYLKSEAIPSPMGANISAFKNPISRAQVVNENEGDLLSWNSLLKGFIKK